MGILSGPVFGLNQLIDLLMPVGVGALLVLGLAALWFAVGLVVNVK